MPATAGTVPTRLLKIPRTIAGKKTGCRQTKGKSDDLADKPGWIDAEDSRDNDGNTDDSTSNPQALGFAGFGPQDPKIEVVSDTGGDHQQKTARRRKCSRETSSRNKRNDPVRQLGHFRRCKNDDIPVGPGESGVPQSDSCIQTGRASGVEPLLMRSSERSQFRCGQRSVTEDLVILARSIENLPVAVIEP